MPQEIIQPIGSIQPIPPISTPKPQQGQVPMEKYSWDQQVSVEAEKLKKASSVLLDKPKEMPLGSEWMRPSSDPMLMSVPDERGWVKKQVDDVGMLASGVVQLVRAAVSNAPSLPKDFAYVLGELTRDPDLVGRQAGHILSEVIKGATSHYRDEGDNITFSSVASGIKDHSLLAALDALGILSLGAGSVAKMAPIVGRVSELGGALAHIPTPIIKGGRIVGTRNITSTEQMLTNAARHLRDAPSKGFDLAMMGAEKIPGVKQVLQGYGLDQQGREFSRMLGTHSLNANFKAYNLALEQNKHLIPKELWGDFNDILMGAKHWDDTLYEAGFNERLRTTMKIQSRYIDEARIAGRKWGSGPISDDALRQSKLKHLADYLGITVDEAAQVYIKNAAKTLELNPKNFDVFSQVYRTSIEDYGLSPARMFADIFEVNPAFSQGLRTIGPSERFTGKAKYHQDPTVYQTNYIVANARLEGIHNGISAGIAKYGRAWVKGAEIPDGWHDTPMPYLRLIDDQRESDGLFAKNLDEGGAKFGPGTPEAHAYAFDLTLEQISSKGVDFLDAIRLVDDNKLMSIVPTSIAKVIDIEMAPVMGWTQWYNKGMNLWRKFVLDWNPKYYVNNLLGNSVLMVMGGVSPAALQTWMFKNMPAEARRATMRLEQSGILGAVGRTVPARVLHNTTEFLARGTDEAPRLLTMNSFAKKAFDEKGIMDSVARRYVAAGDDISELDNLVQSAYNLTARDRILQSQYLRMSAPDMAGIPEAARAEVLPMIAARDKYVSAQKKRDQAMARLNAAKEEYSALERKLGESLGLERPAPTTEIPTIRPASGVRPVGPPPDAPVSTAYGALPSIGRVEQRIRVAGARSLQLDDEIKALKQEIKDLEYSVGVKPLRTEPSIKRTPEAAEADPVRADIASFKKALSEQDPNVAGKVDALATLDRMISKYAEIGGRAKEIGAARPYEELMILRERMSLNRNKIAEELGGAKRSAAQANALLREDIEAAEAALKSLEVKAPLMTPYKSKAVYGEQAAEMAALRTKKLEELVAERKAVNADIAGMKRHAGQVRRAVTDGSLRLKKNIAEKWFDLENAQKELAEVMGPGEAALEQIGAATRGQAIQAAVSRLQGESLRDALDVAGNLRKYRTDIAPLVEPIEKAIKEMEMFLGAYGRGSAFAKKYARNLIPFWTFMATMHRLVMHMPVIRPKTTFLFSQMVQMAVDEFDSDKLPEWARMSLPIGTVIDQFGNPAIVMIRASGLNPFESIGVREIGKLELPKLMDPTQNPLFALGVKLVGGTDTFTREMPQMLDGEIQDFMGRAWKYDGKGNFVKTSRQKPLLDSFMDLIPHTQVFNDVMAHAGFIIPGRQAKYEKAPNGETVLSRPWAAGLLRFAGFTRDEVDAQKAKTKERLNTVRLAKEYMRAAARDRDVDDDERAQLFKEAQYVLRSMK